MLYAIYTGFGQPIVQGWILEREQKINGHIYIYIYSNIHIYISKFHRRPQLLVYPLKSKSTPKTNKKLENSPKPDHRKYE